MFTWICPQCGADVPPSYSECPNCKPVAPPPPAVAQPPLAAAPPPLQATRLGTAPPRATAPTPTAPPVYAAQPPLQPLQAMPAAVAAPAPAAEVQYVYVQKPGLPAWLVTIGVFVALCAAGYAFYSLVLNKNGRSDAASTESVAEPAAAESGAAKGPRGRKDFSKYLEVAGIRIVEENRKPAIRLMLVNHSSAELASLTGTITLTADGKTDIATIPFNLATLGAYEAKDISAPLKTKLRAYEMPDWQFIKAQVKLTNAE